MAVYGGCGTGQVCDNNECFNIVRSNRTFTVPCTRNVREAYTVQVPKTKAITVNKQVPYIEYEPKIKQVPYQYVDRQTVTKNVPTCRICPVTRNVCTNVPVRRRMPGLLMGKNYVRKKCPRTVYVRKKCCEPRQFCWSVQKTGWKTVKENVPVQKFRNQTETRYKTENIPERRYRIRKVTKLVNKTVPVYNLVPKPPPPPPVQEDRIVRTVPAPEQKIILPPVTVLPSANPSAAVTFDLYDASREESGARNEYSAARHAGYGNIAADAGHAGYGNVAAGAGHGEMEYGHQTGALRADFNRIDKNGDGKLSYQEMRFDAADANKDGYLNINEYAAGYGTKGAGDAGAFDVLTSGVGQAVGSGYGNATSNAVYGNETTNAGYVNGAINAGYGNHTMTGGGQAIVDTGYGNATSNTAYGNETINAGYGNHTMTGDGQAIAGTGYGNQTHVQGVGADELAIRQASGAAGNYIS